MTLIIVVAVISYLGLGWLVARVLVPLAADDFSALAMFWFWPLVLIGIGMWYVVRAPVWLIQSLHEIDERRKRYP